MCLWSKKTFNVSRIPIQRSLPQHPTNTNQSPLIQQNNTGSICLHIQLDCPTSRYCPTESVATRNPEPLTQEHTGRATPNVLTGRLHISVAPYYPADFAGLPRPIRTPRREIYQLINTWLCGPAVVTRVTSAGRLRPVLTSPVLTRRAGASGRISASCQCRSAHAPQLFRVIYLTHRDLRLCAD